MKELVSIIIPSFNKQDFIGECVQSVVDQVYENWELIIIDDASTDLTKNVLNEFDKNIKIKTIYLKKNKGPSFCRNLGVREANGTYVAFLDADDFWTKDKLVDQINFMKNNDYKFTFSDYFTFKGKKTNEIIRKTNITDYFDYQSFMKNSSINTSSMIIKKTILGTTRFKNLRLLEDYVFKCDLLKKGHIAYKLNKCSVSYRLFPDSRSSSKIKNLIHLWKINKNFNKLNFLSNLSSLIGITFNSIKKYGYKKYF